MPCDPLGSVDDEVRGQKVEWYMNQYKATNHNIIALYSALRKARIIMSKGFEPSNPMRLYADGVFDLFHFGHARLLEQCKKKFPYVYLIVGVAGDYDVETFKGKPLMNEQERKECLKHCKWVDEVICPCPWTCTIEFMDDHGIDFICHDDIPYTMGCDASGDVYFPSKQAGRFLATQRTEGVSTSDLILRMLQNADQLITETTNKQAARYQKYLKKIRSAFNTLKT